MTRETLIIKLGALGDVLRTTPLLSRLPGKLNWVTDKKSLPLLAGHPRLRRVLTLDSRIPACDLVINLDEDERACALASKVTASRRIGARMKDGKRVYCDASAPWFDMSLISRLGKEKADALKRRNRRSYQELIFKACGFKFEGEEYWTSLVPQRGLRSRIGLEERVGDTWPGKAWPGYKALAELLFRQGLEPVFLRQRSRLFDYLADLNSCGMVVAGDTFAMHAALALRKPTVCLFTCTSPDEIHGYGRLTKIVGPDLKRNFYSREPLPDSSMPGLDEVLGAVSETATAGVP